MTALFEQAKLQLQTNVDYLTQDIIRSSSKYHYMEYKSKALVAWQDTIMNISDNLCRFLSLLADTPELDTTISAKDSDWSQIIKSYFFNLASVYKKKGLDPYTYLGLIKHYRRAYLKVLDQLELKLDNKRFILRVVSDYFDYAEAFSLQAYKSEGKESEVSQELIKNTRLAVYQRNHLISILETIDIPTFCIDKQGFIRHSNHQGYDLLPESLRVEGMESTWLHTIDDGVYHISELINDYHEYYQRYQDKKFISYRTKIGSIHYELSLSRYNEEEDDNTIIFLRDISVAVTNEIELAQQKQQRLIDQQEIIAILGEVLESRSGETGVHVKRVSAIAGYLAKLYGLDESEVEVIKTIAPLHDVGKIAIPDNILNKPGKLTNEEFDLVKTHSEVGYHILKASQSELTQLAGIVAYEHHEKWNGKGYPCGKSGENIHLYARIIAIADVFDALLSVRPYKQAWEKQRVFELFKEEHGQHFDPNLTDLLIENFDQIFKLYTYVEATTAQYIWNPEHIH